MAMYSAFDEGYRKGQIGLLGSILAQLEYDITDSINIAVALKSEGAHTSTIHYVEGKISALTELQERLKTAQERKLARATDLVSQRL